MKTVPGALPSWLSLRHVVSSVHGFGLLTLLVPWFAFMSGVVELRMHGGDFLAWSGLVIGVPSTIAIALATSLFVGRSKSALGAAAASVLGGALTFAAAGVVYAFHTWANAGLGEMMGDYLVASRFFGPHVLFDIARAGGLGAFAGALAGLVLARPAMWAAKNTKPREPSEGVSGRALLGVGIWMLPPTLIALAGLLFLSPGDPSLSVQVLAISWAIALLATLAGASLVYRRSRWLTKVREGQVPRYRIRSAEPSDAQLPGLEVRAEAEDEVLEEVQSGPEALYRAAKLAMPIARVTSRSSRRGGAR